jgi:HD superfamily phosphohydrolase
MYWQAYLHKTSLVAELMLTRILKRAKELTVKGVTLPCSEPLQYFLQHKVTMDTFDDVTLDLFAQLDDFDIISALPGNARVILFYPR